MVKSFLTYFKESKREIVQVFYPTNEQIKESLINVFIMVSFISVFLLFIDMFMTKFLAYII